MEEVDPVWGDEVDEPMFLGDATRPAACKLELEGLWLADAYEGVSHDCLDEVEDPDCNAPILFEPVHEVLAELELEDAGAWARTGTTPA